MGKIWVIFEELPTFSSNQWAGVSSKLKTYTTEKTMMYRDLYEKAFEADNIFNAVINCNTESLKESNGRRVIVASISTLHKKDYDFFDNIKSKCFNMEVGEAFYSYLMEIDTTKFYAQRDFPDTEEKLESISNLLCPTYKFLKSFVLSNTEIGRVNSKEFYDNFTTYCRSNNIKETQLKDFRKRLEEINYVPKKSGTFYYEIILKDLIEIAKKENWLSKYDEIEDNNNNSNEVKISQVEYLELIEMRQENNRLKEEIEQLKKQKVKNVIIHVQNPVKSEVEEPVIEVKKTIIKKRVIKTKPLSLEDIETPEVDMNDF
jgi:hypothetical protein